jgi:phenylalanyl-tRNA synthetase beta chain
MLGVVLAGRRQVGRFDDPSGPVDFADAKGIVEGLAGALGVAEVRYEPAGVMPFHPGRCASIRLGEVPIGVVGQLHPRVAAALDLPAASFAVELELTPLLEASPTTIPATTPSPYPELAFDVAFIVPPGATAQALQATLAEAAGGLLARLTLFDAYQGDPLPPGHRNLAYRVALQAPDRTLSDADAAGVRERMERLASQRLGAVLRGIEGGA